MFMLLDRGILTSQTGNCGGAHDPKLEDTVTYLLIRVQLLERVR